MACFVADRMVERLARWMRLLGEDVAPSPGGADDLFGVAASGRVVLTRDTRLTARLREARRPHLFIEDNRIDDQLRQVDHAYGLGHQAPLTRCSRCNTVLTFHAPGELAETLWPHVAQTQARIGRCATCGRCYWQASHLGRMTAFVVRVFGRDLLGTS